MSKSITILGSTGSVGTATVDVIRSNPSEFSVYALTAHRNVSLLAQQAVEMKAQLAVIGDESLLPELKEALGSSGIKAAAGDSGVMDAASHPVGCVMAAIVGMAGLRPLMAAILSGKHVAIANKEPLVSAGALVLDAAKKSGATLLPVDSEHNAIFQVFEKDEKDKIHRIILTASGGPFRDTPLEKMEAATPEQALAHPNWSMGNKISIDSATMFNKALEVIEAHYLFSMPADKIDVLLHPQSIIHSMVEYKDGSVLAQMGAPDMRVPITHALGWPKRLDGPAQRLDFAKISGLTFGEVDDRRFPAIKLAYDALRQGQAACIAMNAANEVAVSAFLERKIGFMDIYKTVRQVVENCGNPFISGLDSVLDFDSQMRSAALRLITNTTTPDRKVS